MQWTHSQESNNNTCSNSITTPILTLRFTAMPIIIPTFFSAAQNSTGLLSLMDDELSPQQHSHELLVLLYRSTLTTLVTLVKFSTHSRTNNPKLTTKSPFLMSAGSGVYRVTTQNIGILSMSSLSTISVLFMGLIFF